ncbi:Fatty acid synthase subunit beta [Frankliniella fusca]|uniref:Fatty acid synthase subunit beta n=1 Tax=Frankliniella fusca TaxID=407009 RepID=A0AAE1HSV3_9NEOP|nr:Fatty acid synthase subunit beta [Frankliniella fusca]
MPFPLFHQRVASGCPLTHNLEWWSHHVTQEGEHTNVLRWLLFKLRGSKFSVIVASAAVTMSLVNAVTAESLNRADVSIRYFVGVNACICLQLIFIHREDKLRRWLRLVIAQAHQEEADPSAAEESLTLLSRRARRGRLMRRFFVLHAITTEVTFVYTLGIWAPGWLKRSGGEELWKEWARWTVLSLQGYGLMAGLASVYTFLPLVLQVNMACADLFCTLGRKLEVAPCTRTIAASEATLLSACVLADECISDAIAPVVFASLIMPLISLVQALSGAVDSLDALGTAPLFLTVTAPLYLAGDMVASARHQLVRRAGAGPWLNEPVGQRRLRLHVMLAASGRGALLRQQFYFFLRCKGVGGLDRRGLALVLRSWFSFLQAILNLRRRQDG